jgi:hypothetical protein
MKTFKEKKDLKYLALSMKISKLNKIKLSKILGGADDETQMGCSIITTGCPLPPSPDGCQVEQLACVRTSCPQGSCRPTGSCEIAGCLGDHSACLYCGCI